tara:strand:- start:50 stop:241 length:192 start_codon:yes stop_codon:yes gene_type:complete
MNRFYDLPCDLCDKITKMKYYLEQEELELQQKKFYKSFVSAWFSGDENEEQSPPPTFDEWERM